MPNNILMQSYEPRDIFSQYSDWMLREEYKTKTGLKSAADYWEARDTWHAQSINAFTGVEYTDSFDYISSPSVHQVKQSHKAWEALNDILNNGKGGSVLSFDTETIGAFGNSNIARENDISAITEIGFEIKQYGRGKRIPNENPVASFIFGIDDNQEQFLRDSLDKMIRGEELTNVESSALERASRHSTIAHGDSIFRTDTVSFAGRDLKVVASLNESRASSVKDIESGIAALRQLYSESRDDDIKFVAEQITRFGNGNSKHVYTGYNLGYDINVLGYYNKSHNLNISNMDSISTDSVADLMHVLRGNAEVAGVSINDVLTQVNGGKPLTAYGRSGVGNLETVLEALGYANYATEKAHNAFEDSIANRIAMENKDLDIVGKAINIINNGTEDTVNVGDKVLINKNGFVRSSDILIANGKPITSYQTTNQYWIYKGAAENVHIDAVEQSGRIVREAEDRYVMKFESATDKGVFLFKSFDNEEAGNTWWTRNTTINHNVTEADVLAQKEIRDRDIIRREIDSMVQPGSIGIAGKEDTGGFATFKKYYDAIADIKGEGIDPTDRSALEKSLPELIEKSNNVKALFMPRAKVTDAEEILEYRPDITTKLHGIATSFEENNELFAALYANLNEAEGNNLQKTLVMQNIANRYYEGANKAGLSKLPNILYTPEDISNVSFNGSLIDSSDINKATGQIMRSFKSGGVSNAQASRTMLNSLDELEGVLYPEQIEKIRKDNALSTKPYTIAQDIASVLHRDMEQVNALSSEEYGKISILSQISDASDIAEVTGIKESTISKIINKENKTLSESSTSRFSGLFFDENISKLSSGEAYKIAVGKSFGGDIDSAIQEEISNVTNTLITGFDEKAQESMRRNLARQGYDSNAINSLMYMFKDGKGTTLANINRELGTDVSSVYFSTAGEQADFIFLTNQRNQLRLAERLSKLGDDVKASEVEKAVEGLASSIKIPYIEKVDLQDMYGEKNSIQEALGSVLPHKRPEIAIAKQGDYGYGRFVVPSLNIYTETEDGVKKIKGGVTDAGGDFITSIRRVLKKGVQDISENNYAEATRKLNKINNATMTDLANAVEGGFFDESGKIVKRHRKTANDLVKAGSFTMDSNSGLDYAGQIRELFDTLYESETELGSNKSEVREAMENLFKGFREFHGLGYADKYSGELVSSIPSYNAIMGSEEWKEFIKDFMTTQTGGIGKAQEAKYVSKAFAGKSMLNIMADMANAIDDSRMGSYTSGNQVIFPVRDAFNALSEADNKGLIDAVVSETMSKKSGFYFKGFAPQDFSNSQAGSPIRPTYVQALNARPYSLNEIDQDINQIERNSQVKFGRLYAPESYLRGISLIDEAEGLTDKGSRTRTSFVGTVKSISDAELQENIALGEDEIRRLATQNGLDDEIATFMAKEMSKNINMYEGKGYMRASVGNLEYLQRGDPKVVKLPGFKQIFEEGTKEEKSVASNIAVDLYKNNRSLKKGTVLGTLSGKNVIYNGPTVTATEELFETLRKEGRAEILPSVRQASDIKTQIGLEKSTTETFNYLDFYERTMSSLDSASTSDTDKFIAAKIAKFDPRTASGFSTMAQYSDLIEDVYFGDYNGIRSTMILNTNIGKHLSDTAIETKWNLLFNEYAKAGKSETLVSYLNDIAGKGSFYYDANYDTVGVRNITESGRINLLDSIYAAMEAGDPGNIGAEKDINARILEKLKYYQDNNMAMGNIQRQFMTTFEGEEFRMDTRMYQTMLMQESGDYTKGISAQYAEELRRNIILGHYDKNVAGIGNKAYNTARKKYIMSRRGVLAPKDEIKTLLGIEESMGALLGKTDLSKKNIVELNLQDLFANIPQSGTDTMGFGDFIFRKDGKLTNYLISRMESQGINPNTPSNVFKIDLSGFDGLKYTIGRGKNAKDIALKELYLPIQNISSTNGEVFLTESARKTTRVLNALNQLSKQGGNTEDNVNRVNKAINELFNSFKNEMDVLDKNSLAAKMAFRMSMPNSAAGLAIDAVVPFDAPASQSEVNRIARTLKAESENGNITSDLIKEAKTSYQKLGNELADNIENKFFTTKNGRKIINVDALNFTANNRYKHLVKGEGNNVFQNAVVIGDEMFEAMEMDRGHIGLQVFEDYFGHEGKQGLRKFDNFDFVTREEYKINKRTLNDIKRRLVDEVDKEFGQETDLATENIRNWRHNIEIALNDAMETNSPNEIYRTIINGRSVYTGGGTSVKVPGIYKMFDDLGSEISKKDLSETERLLHETNLNRFINAVNKAFEPLGGDYLSRVGILGDAGRYPFFSEGAVLPVRVFFDESVKGRGIKFLGPQFSVLQNLDFDGDNEFLRLFGNGGLLSKDTKEYMLLKQRFNKMNSHNTDIIYNYLVGDQKGGDITALRQGKNTPDYLKSYMYGDDKYFRYKLLKDMKSDWYDIAEKDFTKAIGEDAAKELEEAPDEVKELLMAHSKQFSRMFNAYDAKYGNAMLNPGVVRAAIRARTGKEFIGNYSKPNLDIRDTLTYLLRRTEGEENQKLARIRNVIGYIDGGGPRGILTMLEQEGIDTKHVHDAELLNSSQSWREGIERLFKNSTGSAVYSESEQVGALAQMVKGSRKVLFKDTKATDNQIANAIKRIDLDTFEDATRIQMALEDIGLSGLTSEEVNAVKSLRAIYDLSNFKTASGASGYTGYYNGGKKAKTRLMDEFIESIIADKVRDEYIKGNDLGSIAQDIERRAEKVLGTDEVLAVGDNAIREGDIVGYIDENENITSYVYRGSSGRKARFEEYNLTKQEGTGRFINLKGNNGEINKKLENGISIDDLNNAIKNNPRKKIADNFVNREENRLWNVNDFEISNAFTNVASSSGRKARQQIVDQAVYEKLGYLFNQANEEGLSDDEFKAIFDLKIASKNQSVANTMEHIVGNDATAFRNNAQKVYSQIRMAKNNGNIFKNSNNLSVPALIDDVNRVIASKGRRNNIQRFDNIQTYLGELEDSYILDPSSAVYNNVINNIDVNANKSLTKAEQAIAKHQTEADAALYTLRDKMAGAIDSEGKDAAELHQELIKVRRDSSQVLAEDLGQIFNNTNEQVSDDMLKFLNWDRNILNANKIQVNSHMKIGFGEYTGRELREFSAEQIEYLYSDLLNSFDKNFLSGLDKSQQTMYNTTMAILLSAKRNKKTLDLSEEGIENFVSASYDKFAEEEQRILQAQRDNLEKEVGKSAEEIAHEADGIDNAEKMLKDRLEREGKSRRKTLLRDGFKDLEDSTKKRIKYGAGVIGGLALLGGIAHTLRNTREEANPNIPAFSSSDTNYNTDSVISNKNDLSIPNEPSQAAQVRRQPKEAPSSPKLPKRRTIYNDPNSGLKFKVSANSYNKLEDHAYEKLSRYFGASNSSLNVSKDRSTVTDNWLQNKFAELSE